MSLWYGRLPSCSQTMRGVFLVLSFALAIRCYLACTRVIDGILDSGSAMTQWAVTQSVNIAEPMYTWIWWLCGSNLWIRLLQPWFSDGFSPLSVSSFFSTPPFHSTSPSPPPSSSFFSTPPPSTMDAVSAAVETATAESHVALDVLYSALSSLKASNISSLASALPRAEEQSVVHSALHRVALWILSPAGATAIFTCLLRRA